MIKLTKILLLCCVLTACGSKGDLYLANVEKEAELDRPDLKKSDDQKELQQLDKIQPQEKNPI